MEPDESGGPREQQFQGRRHTVWPPDALSSNASTCSWAAISLSVGRITTTRNPRDARRGRVAGAAARGVRFGAQREHGLSAGHRQIHFRQNARVEQGAVIVAMRIVDRVTLAQGIEVVALAGVHLARQRQGVEHPAYLVDLVRQRRARELGIQERHIEGSVVDDQLRIPHELQEVGMYQ